MVARASFLRMRTLARRDSARRGAHLRSSEEFIVLQGLSRDVPEEINNLIN